MPRRKVSGEEFVCPVCFVVFPAGTVNLKYLTCPHCESEALGVDLEPLSFFFNRVTLAELQRIAKEWENQKGFLPAYKAEKQSRLRTLINRQKGRHRDIP